MTNADPSDHDSPLPVARTVSELRTQAALWRREGLRIGFVPTMGALHEGHLSLIDCAFAHSDRVVASIFVNPTQFAPHEDLDSYPRQVARDLALLADRGAHLAFTPGREEVYPADFSTMVQVKGLDEGLCGASRPHFFGGVATVVAKLLNMAQADVAVFGEKDYQQLLIIKRLARDLDIPTQIIGGPIIRESDGLAMSSRNQYLSVAERAVAGRLNVEMRTAIMALRSGAKTGETLAQLRETLNQADGASVDYLELRSGDDLSALPENAVLDQVSLATGRLFAAMMVGKTRLIDNMPLSPADQ